MIVLLPGRVCAGIWCSRCRSPTRHLGWWLDRRRSGSGGEASRASGRMGHHQSHREKTRLFSRYAKLDFLVFFVVGACLPESRRLPRHGCGESLWYAEAPCSIELVLLCWGLAVVSACSFVWWLLCYYFASRGRECHLQTLRWPTRHGRERKLRASARWPDGKAVGRQMLQELLRSSAGMKYVVNNTPYPPRE